MKCSLCGKEIPELGSKCPGCGQPVEEATGFASVDRIWNLAEEETKKYEQKRDQARQEVAKTFRKKRKGRFLRRVLVVLALAVLLIMGGGMDLVNDGVTYMNAWWAMEQGEYARAEELFYLLDGDFLNTWEYRTACHAQVQEEAYMTAMSAYWRGAYEEALAGFETLGDYKYTLRYADLCRQEILAGIPEPVRYWAFDDGAQDQYGGTSEPGGDVTVGKVIDSRVRSAAAFDGSEDYILCGSGTNVTENWSVSIQFACRSLEKDMTLFAKYGSEEGCAYRIYIHAGKLLCQLVLEDGSSVSLECGEDLTVGDCWYFATLVREGSKVNLYVNGWLVDEAELTGAVRVSEDPVHIGAQRLVAEGEEKPWFHGFIGQVKVYEEALTAGQAKVLYYEIADECEHPWDTSFYYLPEEAERDHFLIYRADERYEALVFDMQEGIEAYFEYDAENGIVSLIDGMAVNCARYYQEGESWILIESDLEYAVASTWEILGSDLDVYYYDDLILPRVIIGGRG